MPFALDCSVTVPWYVEDEQTPFTESLLQQIEVQEYWVPALWRLEFSNALLIAERRMRIPRERRLEILRQAESLGLKVDAWQHSMEGISEIAQEFGLTTYDAVYFELAKRRKLTLVTLDEALVQAAREAGLPFLTDAALFPEPGGRRTRKPK